MKGLMRAALVLALCGVFGSAFAAGPATWTNNLRFGLSYFAPTGSSTGTMEYVNEPGYVFTEAKVKAKSVLGFAAGYEHAFSPLFGLEVYTGYYKPKYELDDSAAAAVFPNANGSADLIPVGLSGNFHLVKTDKLDFYVAPTIAYIFYGKPKLDYSNSFGEVGFLEVKFKNELSYGVRVGLDLPLGPQWGLAFQLSYLSMKAKVESITDSFSTPVARVTPTVLAETISCDFKPNPVVFNVMASYRF